MVKTRTGKLGITSYAALALSEDTGIAGQADVRARSIAQRLNLAIKKVNPASPVVGLRLIAVS